MSRPRILVVDDEEQIRVAMCRWFGMRGFEVDDASDGIEAIEKCEGSVYDVVTMDLEMPHMHGSEAIAILKKKYPALPIVVLTGYMNAPDDAWRTGAARIFVKPVSLRHLEDQIRKMLNDNGLSFEEAVHSEPRDAVARPRG